MVVGVWWWVFGRGGSGGGLLVLEFSGQNTIFGFFSLPW